MGHRTHIRRALIAVLVSGVAISAHAGSRRAVLVGINDYSASGLKKPAGLRPSPDRGWLSLSGAVNDVTTMREMLIALYGFAPTDIVLLKDQTATRAAILHAIDEHLLTRAAAGDVLLFYYAGHGSQVRNWKSDERDKRDESIVPADSRAGAPDIRDKELRRVFNRILDKGARLTVILDSCHSASGVRGLPSGAAVRSIEPDLRDVADGAALGPRPEDRGALVIAATQDFGTAAEAIDEGGNSRGSFSWAWARAVRDAAPGEAAMDTFLRAQAHMRIDVPSQDPVLAGNADARLRPFLGSRRDHRGDRMVVAVAETRGDGTVAIQGGWANGLTPGTILRGVNNGALRVRVAKMIGAAQCEGRVTAGGGSPKSGELLEVAAWSAPPGGPLRVWMPAIGGPVGLPSTLAAELAREAAKKHVHWVVDPTEEAATHVLRRRNDHWELLSHGAVPQRVRADDAVSLIAGVPAGAALFVQLPAPRALVDRITIGPRSEFPGIEATSRPEEADYFLAGRYAEDRVEYAWVLPAVAKADQSRTPLPARTTWRPILSLPDTAARLTDEVIGLRRIRSWQSLISPPDAASPYRLLVRRVRDGAPVTAGTLIGHEEYRLAMTMRSARPPQLIEPRWVYAFAIDSFGRSRLLFPRSGSVENRLPLNSSPPPGDVALPATFTVGPPYGEETYFLLTTEEPLPNPWILEWRGVRERRTPGNTPLEELFRLMFAGSRSAVPMAPLPQWSIERLSFRSIPEAK